MRPGSRISNPVLTRDDKTQRSAGAFCSFEFGNPACPACRILLKDGVNGIG